jgi:hypothetical protein
VAAMHFFRECRKCSGQGPFQAHRGVEAQGEKATLNGNVVICATGLHMKIKVFEQGVEVIENACPGVEVNVAIADNVMPIGKMIQDHKKTNG